MERLTRFAPTPSGYLHFGNALNFFLVWAWARREKMSILLRIDDVDQSRFRQDYLDDIFLSLQWLGLDYHFGPKSSDEFLKQYSQNLKMEKYLHHARRLHESGLTYFCSCSRKDIGPSSYQGTCREKNLSSGIMRLNLDRCRQDGIIDDNEYHNLLNTVGDFAIVDRDRRAMYQLVSVIEDLEAGVTHIMRGEDLAPSTKAQQLLAVGLKFSAFKKIRFCFHDLVSSPEGKKLSKSAGAFALKNLYSQNADPSEFYSWASSILDVGDVGPKCESANCLADSLSKDYFDRDFIHFA